MGDEREQQEPEEEDAGKDAPPPADDPNQSTEGLLDEQALREHADEVDAAIQEAKSRNG
jgi:hypothetical protein